MSALQLENWHDRFMFPLSCWRGQQIGNVLFLVEDRTSSRVPASMHRTVSNLKKDVSIWIIILKTTSMSSRNLPHTSHCPVQVVQVSTWSASKVLLWSSAILVHYIAAGIMKVMKVTLCLQLVAAHCTAPALPSLMINCTWYKLQYPTFFELRVNHYILTTMMIIMMALMTLTHSMFLQNNYLCCNVWQCLHTLIIIYYIT